MRGKRDGNHATIKRAYETLHCSVFDTADVANGFPDLVVGCGGVTALVEVKTARGELTEGQEEFIRYWRGAKVRIVRSANDVVQHVQDMRFRFHHDVNGKLVEVL